jgi:predicted acylesterase/phospholipase RssA
MIDRRAFLTSTAALAASVALPRAARAADATRTLVLCGGGATGTAWETGLLLGLQRGGVDPNATDVVIGTSAGSIVGAQMRSGIALDRLYTAQITARKLEVVAVDALDGSVHVFDGREPVALNLAVAASAAVPSFTPPITIGGRRYIDGGVASRTGTVDALSLNSLS